MHRDLTTAWIVENRESQVKCRQEKDFALIVLSEEMINFEEFINVFAVQIGCDPVALEASQPR